MDLRFVFTRKGILRFFSFNMPWGGHRHI